MLVDKLVVRYLYNILWHMVYPYVLWGFGRGMQKANAASFMYSGIGLLCFHLVHFIWSSLPASLDVSCFGF